MTSGLGMHNIPLDMHNISPTCTTSLGGDLRKRDVVDVVHVVPKKNVPSTYLLSVVTGASYLLRPVRGTQAPIPTHVYPLHNMHNIPKTWHATSHSVQMARVLDDLAARQATALHRLARQKPAIRRSPR